MNHDLDRERYRRLRPDAPPQPPAVAAPPAFVGQVTTAAGLIGVGKFLNVTPQDVTGAETEGGGPALTALSGSVPAILLGPDAATTGDMLICRFLGNRWVTTREVPVSPPPGHTLPGCPCATVPDGLTMHVASQPPPTVESVVFTDSLTRQARPAALSAYRSDDPGWYGSGEFTSSDGFYKFIYWFGCSQGSYFVGGLLTPDSPLGYPGFFLISSWLIGLPGNTCSPFQLHDTSGAATPTMHAQGITVD